MQRMFWTLAAMILLLGLLAACGDSTEDQTEQLPTPQPTVPTSGSTDGSATSTAAASADLTFIDAMIPHHEGAVEMGQIALDEAEHAELRTLAQAIIDAQTSEIAQLRAWREEWFPGAAATGNSGDMHDMEDMTMSSAELDAMRAAEPFDAAFINMMIPHHESAIMMAEQVLTETNRTDIRELAQAIIQAQQAEITEMREWLAAWYGQ